MTKKILALSLLIATILLSACRSEVDIDIPDQYPKLVVGSFINPEDFFIAVYVRSSSPIFTTYEDIDIDEIISEATVKISDGTTEVEIPFEENEGYHLLNVEEFPINYGGTYTLTVSAPGFTTVEATTTVPDAQPVFTESAVIDVDSVTQDFFSYIDYTMRYSWQDTPNQNNYYRIYTQEVNAGAYLITDKFLTDEGEDGQLLTTLGYVQSNMDGSGDAFNANLINASEDYYLYHKSIANLTYGDPFAEPTLVYSNVKNGLGCFGAFTSTQVVFTP